MIGISEATKIYLFAEPVDMRKGFDGLSYLVKRQGLDIFSGHLFVFISRRGDRIMSSRRVGKGRSQRVS